MFAPERIWWKPLDRLEKRWVTIAVGWCLVLTAMMPIWLAFGNQNTPATTLRTDPANYMAATEAFVAEYQVGEYEGRALVAPPAGGDAYIVAQRFQFTPVLQLEKGETYRVHVSSMDVLHGLSIQPVNLNFEIVPGYEFVITLTPTESGEFQIVCNEFCGIGHHVMSGKILVNE
jgi:cytochrome c oxidase subunit 2